MQIFFACMCATLTLNLSRSAGKALIHSGSFGWFNQVRQEARGRGGAGPARTAVVWHRGPGADMLLASATCL